MPKALAEFRNSPLARPALMVPMLIMLIFSLFNLTSAPDPARSTAAFRLGVVNQDEGLSFPPIKVASRVMDGLGSALPFNVTAFETADSARQALEGGEVAAVILFPPEFSKQAVADEPFEIDIWNAQHLTVAETQMGAQLPMMVQMAMSAGVASLRLALAKGQIPSGSLPVTAKVDTLYLADSSTRIAAPFVLTFATWLAAFVAAVLTFIATRDIRLPWDRAAVRTVVPVFSTGIGTVVLALVAIAAIGSWGLFLPLWLTAWGASLALVLMMLGGFAAIGLVAIIVFLPMAFYQGALGGAMAPVAAAPDWLRSIGEAVPFDLVGAVYRNVLHGASLDVPLIWLAGAGLVGLALIWLAGLVAGMRAQ